MKVLRFLFTLGALTLLAALPVLLQGSAPTAFAAASFSAKIDSHVLDATANGGRTSILLVLGQQANISGAAKLATKLEKGQFIFNAVRATAARTQPAVRAALDRLGLSYRAYYIVNLFAVENVTRSQVQQLAARPDIARIESDAPVRIPLPKPTLIESAGSAPQGIEWNISKINAPAVWAKGFKGQGIVYSNQDTGVQWDHPALKNQYRGWNGTTADHNYNWWDAIHAPIVPSPNPCGYSSPVPCDDYGHGTHTMGTGVGDDGQGNQIGVAPAAKWIACHNMDQGTGRPSTYIECFQFFLAPWDLNGQNPDPSRAPDVMSNSWGCPTSEQCTPNSLLSAVQADRAAGIFIAVSAGNSGPSCSTVTDPPAIYNASTTVGATDINDNLASFSSRGPVTVDGSNRLKPDISAPGVNVRSAYPGNQYAIFSGTSMASPHVAGAVALGWSEYPGAIGKITKTEAALFKFANRNVGASGTCGGTGPGDIPNNLFGYGRLDVARLGSALAQ
jgi:serine protease AprX